MKEYCFSIPECLANRKRKTRVCIVYHSREASAGKFYLLLLDSSTVNIQNGVKSHLKANLDSIYMYAKTIIIYSCIHVVYINMILDMNYIINAQPI